MALSYFRTLIHELWKKDTDIFPKEAPLNILDSKSAYFMDKNIMGTNHTIHIVRRVHFVRNGEK